MGEARGGATIAGYRAFHAGNLLNATTTTPGLMSAADKIKTDATKPIAVQGTAPSSPGNGDLWIDTSV